MAGASTGHGDDERDDGSDAYVHDPARFDEGEESDDPTAGARPAGAEREFGWRGWVLVGFTVVAFFVVPGLLLALAYYRGAVVSLGLGWRPAYLVLPLVPALLLGALAVWATTR